MNNKIKIVKTVTSFVVGSGTTIITKGIIENNTAGVDSIYGKIAVGAASVVIGSMSARATKAHTDTMIDELVESYEEVRVQMQTAN